MIGTKSALAASPPQSREKGGCQLAFQKWTILRGELGSATCGISYAFCWRTSRPKADENESHQPPRLEVQVFLSSRRFDAIHFSTTGAMWARHRLPLKMP